MVHNSYVAGTPCSITSPATTDDATHTHSWFLFNNKTTAAAAAAMAAAAVAALQGVTNWVK